MKPEAAACLDKARRDLADVKAIAAIGLAAAAARTGYYAAFRNGHHRENRHDRQDPYRAPRQDRRSQPFGPCDRQGFADVLGQAYVYKEISDYGADREVTVTPGEAQDAIAEAARLIERVTAMLTSPSA